MASSPSIAPIPEEKLGELRQGPWPKPPDAPKSFKQKFLHMLGSDDAPERVAASFALGVAISFTPTFGFHLITALFLAFLLKLKKVDVVLGTLVVNPLTLAPVSWLAIHVGRFMLQARREAVSHLPWREMLNYSFWANAGPTMRAIGVQWAIGMFALSVLAGAITYAVVLRAIVAHRARLAAKAAAASAAAT